jgi:hypothetical protein
MERLKKHCKFLLTDTLVLVIEEHRFEAVENMKQQVVIISTWIRVSQQ